MSSPTVPTITVSKENIVSLYNLAATTNNLVPYTPLSGSVFQTTNCKSGTVRVYVFLKSGSATSMGGSGSKYYVDWSPNNIDWMGTGSNTGYTGSFNALNTWNTIVITGSAPYLRVVLVNTSGSSISGSIVALGS
jgi:hypothetical protein